MVLIVVLLSLLGTAHCAEKRDINQLVQEVILPIEQRIQTSVATVENVTTSAFTKATEVLRDTMGYAQQLANKFIDTVQEEFTKAVQLGKSVTSCVSGAAEKAAEIVKKTGSNIQLCTKSAITPIQDLQTDLLSLQKQTAQLIADIPKEALTCVKLGLKMVGCFGQLAQNVTARALMYSSSSTQDLMKVGFESIHLPGNLTRCGVAGAEYATTHFTSLTTLTISCIQNGNT